VDTPELKEAAPQERRTFGADSLTASLTYLAAYHGRAVSPEALLGGLPILDGRLSVALYDRAARRAGLETEAIKRDILGIPALVLPAVLIMKNGTALVLLGLDAASGTAKVLDPLAPAVRAIGAPLLRDAVTRAPELKAALLARCRELGDAGYHAQVLVEEKTPLFFVLENGERKQLRIKDAECAALADRVESVSPNALLRPVWQDFMLPTVAYVGGPGELAYFAQSAVLYDRLLGRMPVVLPRACFTLLDERSAKLLKRFGLSLTDLMTSQESLRERIARKLVPQQLGAEFEKAATAAARWCAFPMVWRLVSTIRKACWCCWKALVAVAGGRKIKRRSKRG